jgi:hypothetical protein
VSFFACRGRRVSAASRKRSIAITAGRKSPPTTNATYSIHAHSPRMMSREPRSIHTAHDSGGRRSAAKHSTPAETTASADIPAPAMKASRAERAMAAVSRRCSRATLIVPLPPP